MMRRRRNFLRPIVARPIRYAILDQAPRQLLRNAHSMMDSGNYEQAAITFSKLGEGALSRGMDERAPYLFLQAGRAYSMMNDFINGKLFFLRGLNLFAENKQWNQVYKFCDRISQEMEAKAQGKLAQEIIGWRDSVIPAGFTPLPTLGQATKKTTVTLPPKCPYCGATVSPVEVEWLNETSAACMYCGSVIQG
jgi:hypothetical protein